ncbi:hypothetical protein U1Q18_005927 [Sarracenia purpurea var. burkii]
MQKQKHGLLIHLRSSGRPKTLATLFYLDIRLKVMLQLDMLSSSGYSCLCFAFQICSWLAAVCCYFGFVGFPGLASSLDQIARGLMLLSLPGDSYSWFDYIPGSKELIFLGSDSTAFAVDIGDNHLIDELPIGKSLELLALVLLQIL